MTIQMTVTDDDIRALRSEALAHGDVEQAKLCAEALGAGRTMRERARRICEYVIRSVRAERAL